MTDIYTNSHPARTALNLKKIAFAGHRGTHITDPSLHRDTCLVPEGGSLNQCICPDTIPANFEPFPEEVEQEVQAIMEKQD